MWPFTRVQIDPQDFADMLDEVQTISDQAMALLSQTTAILHRIDPISARVGTILANQRALEAKLMATQQDLMAAVAALKTDFETYRDGVGKALADVKANAAGSQIVSDAMDAAIAAVNAVDAEVKGSGAVASAPPPVNNAVLDAPPAPAQPPADGGAPAA